MPTVHINSYLAHMDDPDRDPIVVIETATGAVSISDYNFPKNCTVLVGSVRSDLFFYATFYEKKKEKNRQNQQHQEQQQQQQESIARYPHGRLHICNTRHDVILVVLNRKTMVCHQS